MSDPIPVISRADFERMGGSMDDPADHPVQTFAEHALDSASLGNAEPFLQGFYKGTGSARSNQEASAQMNARSEANPIAGPLGTATGFLTPGPGLLGKAAKSAATAAGLGKIATRAIAGGIENGVYGLSHAMNEDYMGDPKMAAEHVAAGTLGNALLGGTVNVLLGGAGDLAKGIGKSVLVKAFGGDAVKSKLSDLSESLLMKSVAGEKDLAKRNLESRSEGIAQFALENGFAKAGVKGGFKGAAEAANTRAGQAYQDIQNGLSEADTRGAFDPLAAAARLQKKIDSMQGSELSTTRAKLQNFVDNDLLDVGKPASPGQTIKSWDRAKNAWGEIPVPGTEQAGTLGEAPTTFKQAWEKVTKMADDPDLYNTLRADLKDEIFKQATTLDQGLGNRLDQAAREQHQALEFRTLAGNKAKAAKEVTPWDYALGAAGFHAGGIPGLLAPVAKRAVKERAGFAAASALDAMAGNGTLPKIAEGFQLFMKNKLADPGFGGAFRQTLEAAASKGATDLLQTHVALAKDPQYMMSVGLEHEDPSTVASHVDRAHGLAQMSTAMDAIGAEADKHIDRALTPGTDSEPPAQRQPTREEYESLKTKLKGLVSNQTISPKLSSLAPTTASLAAMNVSNAAAYLLDKAPKNPTEGLPPALQRPWAPGAGDLRAWFRRVDAVARPQSVLEQMNGGIVSKEAVDALKAIYPTLASNYQHRMMARLSEWKEPLDRARRGHVSQLIGDISDPAVTQLIQAAHLRATPPPSAGQQPDGRETIDAAKNEATQAQRLEGK